MKVIQSRNVNDALAQFMRMSWEYVSKDGWRNISPRGLATREWITPVATVYSRPTERVLFCPDRDANPFFHLMESLWILAGRNDVAFLAKYNKRMELFSDDGNTFHAPYGQRLRKWALGTALISRQLRYAHIDQIKECVQILKNDPDSRQAVMSIWNPAVDLGTKTKDLPCNDLIMLKVRNGALNMTVACRSNDVIWGAYGANAVQFSMIQEFMALAIGVRVGTYTQISDSYHYYLDNEAYKRLYEAYCSKRKVSELDPYSIQLVTPTLLMRVDPDVWLHQCELFCEGNLGMTEGVDPFFTNVACPMQKAWEIYKDHSYDKKNQAIAAACAYLFDHCHASDWCMAGIEWLRRREQ